jgi:transposase
MQAYSIDLRQKVIEFIAQGNTQKLAANIFNLNKATVNRWWIRYKTEGHIRPRINLGKKPKVTEEEFKIYISQNLNFTTVEMGRYFNISSPGAFYWLRKFGFSYKKKAFTYVEANQEKRYAYQEVIKDIAPQKLVYIDESGIEMKTCKDRGWGKKSEKLVAKKSGKYYERTNIIAGYVNKKSIAPMVFNGSCNTNVFNNWVEHFLIKELKPGQVVVMDNASFHKSYRTKELIESVGCRVIFLPPYSPDLNPIEKFWANMKRWIKQKIENFEHLFDSIAFFFKYAMST